MADAGILRPLLRSAVPDHLVHHGDPKRLLDEEGLSPDVLLKRILEFAAKI
jgi:deoxyxylulose-5-phosphate synthase